jgi:ribose transport system permease protein
MTATTGQPNGLQKLLTGPASGVLILLGFYLALLIVFSLLSPFFMTTRNMLAISSNVAFIGLMAAAGTPLIIAGGLDLSVAAVAGLSGVLIALLHTAGWPIWLAVAGTLGVGVIVGLVNGFLATTLRLNPLIVTLATMSIVGGLALILTGGLTKPLSVPGFNWIGAGRFAGIPVPAILMVIVYGVLAFVLRATHFGRYVYAVGGNPEASRLIGLPVKAVQVWLYVISALSGAVAGTMLAAMLGAAAPNAASPHLLTVIAAIILGGTSLQGGRGSVWGTLLAVLILGTLNNGLTLMDVSSFWQDVTRGVVLILAVGVDALRLRLQAR